MDFFFSLDQVILYRYTRKWPLGGQKREGLLLYVRDQIGQESWGDISPLPGFSRETIDQAEKECCNVLFPFFAKKHFSFETISSLLTFTCPSVHFGVESALLDLCMPLPPRLVPLCGLVPTLKSIENNPHFLLEELLHSPFSTIKLKVTLSQMKAIPKWLEEVGTSLRRFRLRIDCQNGFSLLDIHQLADLFAPFQVDYFEDPTPSLSTLCQFSKPIGLDSTARNISPFSLARLPTLQAIIVKPTLSGGWSRLKPLADFWKKKGVAFILSSSYESEIGISQIAKLYFRLCLPYHPMGLDTCRFFSSPVGFSQTTIQGKGELLSSNEWKINSQIVHERIRMSF